MLQKTIQFLKSNEGRIIYIVVIFLFCFLTLMVKSNNSFLHPTNIWDDSNAFFTVGKSILDGKILYKDIFEQKGPLFYFIYAIGAFFSPKNFYGVFCLEVLFATVGVFWSYKIVKLYIKSNKKSLIISLIFWMMIVSSNSIFLGGSTEEFCFPFFMISIYYFFRHIKYEEMTYREFRLVVFLSGCVFLIKYNLLGLWFAFMTIMFFDNIISGNYKKALGYSINFLIGMVIPFVTVNVYMLANGALVDFYRVYFFCNMKPYLSSSYSEYNYVVRFILNFYNTVIISNSVLICILILIWPIILLKSINSKKECIYFAIMLIFSVLCSFVGIRSYAYYLLPIVYQLLIPLSLILNSIIDEKNLNEFTFKYQIFVLIVALLIIYIMDPFKNYFLESKSDIILQKYADIINQEENPTLVNMGGLDVGLYLFADVLPNTYFFELQNYEYESFPYIMDAFNEYIANKETMFIVFFTKMGIDDIYNEYVNLSENYELIENDEYFYKKIYLFKVK